MLEERLSSALSYSIGDVEGRGVMASGESRVLTDMLTERGGYVGDALPSLLLVSSRGHSLDSGGGDGVSQRGVEGVLSADMLTGPKKSSPWE